MHAEGASVTEMADAIGVTVGTCRKHLKRLRLTPKGGSRPVYDPGAIVTAYLAGKSLRECADQFGCAWQTVANALDKYHVVRRNPDTQKGRRRPTTRPQSTRPAAQAVRADVARLYAAGVRTPARIAAELGVAWTTARAHLRALDLEPEDGRHTARRGRRPDLDVQVMAERYEAGFTPGQIAAVMATSPATVRDMLKAHGVTMRDDRKGNTGRHRTYDPSIVATVQRLAGGGFSVPEIALYCRIGQPAVERILDDQRQALLPGPGGAYADGHPQTAGTGAAP